jgi:hypothetical protein
VASFGAKLGTYRFVLALFNSKVLNRALTDSCSRCSILNNVEWHCSELNWVHTDFWNDVVPDSRYDIINRNADHLKMVSGELSLILDSIDIQMYTA